MLAFFGDQQLNCWACCTKWGVAMEIDNDVKSDEVKKLVVELMNGDKGNEMRKNIADLKIKVEEAYTSLLGSSMAIADKLFHLLQESASI